MKVFTAPVAALLVLASLQPANADYSVSVAAKTQLVSRWDGWGTSLAWWANIFGTRADVADMIFTAKDAVAVVGTGTVPGLNFNIARYNIGGSGNNVINDNGKKVTMEASSKMPAFRFIESFWLDWFNSDPTSSSWNWNADAAQRAMLVAAKQRGANLFEAFSNSPPWWMTNNHAVAGGKKGKDDNLQSWNHEQFAGYLATVVKQAKDNWGVDFQYVEPFNEPMANWWTFPGTQEGCHFTIDTQKSVLLYLRKQLDERGLQSVAVAASDENSADQALSTLNSLSKTQAVASTFTKVNTHGYSGLDAYRGKNRGPLRDLVKKLGKTLWDSEYGESDGSGLTMAESIGLDINDMGVSAFVYWQALDSGGWGLVQSNPGDNWMGTPNAKYYVMAQYSRHIRQGMQIIGSTDKKTVVAYDAATKTLVLVTVNTGAAQSITFDLSSYSSVAAGTANVWTTVTGNNGARYHKSTLAVSGKSLKVAFPAGSVITIEISGVAL